MNHILTINGGSSSIKFALFDEGLTRVLAGQFSSIGADGSELEVSYPTTGTKVKRAVAVTNHAACIPLLIDLVSKDANWQAIGAVGNRIVHGGARFLQPERVTPQLLTELERLAPYAPEHLPAEIALLRALTAHDPQLLQVACFDTAFHRTMPQVTKMLPLPRHFYAQGLRRYGFHGLSYEYLLSQLVAAHAAGGRIILAHLGNGASMAAVRDGSSIDTSMSFTPTAGLVMSNRSGDLDPGLVAYLARTLKMTAAEFQHMVNAEAGLLGVSETSSEMHKLLAREESDERAADAVAMFCLQAKKFVGAYTAELGGLDTLVFSGGIGENSSVIRERICSGLEFMGIELDAARNQANATVISQALSRVTVRVIKTDEEIQIARHTQALMSSEK